MTDKNSFSDDMELTYSLTISVWEWIKNHVMNMFLLKNRI